MIDLTPYSGRRSKQDSTMIVLGMEVTRKRMGLLALGLLPMAMVMGLLSPLGSAVSLSVGATVLVAWVIGLEMRQRRGMRSSLAVATLDKVLSKKNEVILYEQSVTGDENVTVHYMQRSVSPVLLPRRTVRLSP